MKIISDTVPEISERTYPTHRAVHGGGRAVIVDYVFDGKESEREFFFEF